MRNVVYFSAFLAPILSFFVTFFVLRWMVQGGAARFVLDNPNQRSLHTSPIPRTGGLALMAGALVAWSILLPFWFLPMIGFGLLLMAVSFADDVFNLPAGWRFVAHFAVAMGWFVQYTPLLDGWLPVVMIFAMVWMVNLYNFMDGSDGLAGGMALFGFGFYGLEAWIVGETSFALANFSLVTASVAFLIFNRHPAKVFMGDAGSIPLGYFAAAFGLQGWQNGIWPLWFPILVFSPFIVDASATLVKRLLCGDKIWQAHREHYYQRLVQMGIGHRNTAIAEYILMAVVGTSAIWAIGRPLEVQVAVIAGFILIYLALMWIIDTQWKRYCD